jgi:cytochrome d ubiquinol oxidase subunit I
VISQIVQEFQFETSWINYSRVVGDVFGASLAIEALVAFFLEATFIGQWIFGWAGYRNAPTWPASEWGDRYEKLSAFFVLAAYSWIQHPVGFEIDPERGRAQLWEVLNNSTNQVAYPHVATAAFVTAAAFVRIGAIRSGSGTSGRAAYRQRTRPGAGQ